MKSHRETADEGLDVQAVFEPIVYTGQDIASSEQSIGIGWGIVMRKRPK